MKIGNVNRNVNFRMKIVQNDELEDLISNLQVKRGYSQRKIERIMDSIKKMADDSYKFEVNKVNTYTDTLWYTITTDNEDAAVDERGNVCSTSKFFMLHNIKKTCKKMFNINNDAGSSNEIFEYAGK